MITTFKTFNTKTKEVKEYSKPDFGDFGRYIEISDCEIFPIHTDHELNTLHNRLFKDCIYTNGDWVGVLQKSFEYKDKIYKVGDIFSLFYSRGVENKVYDLELRMLRYDGMCFIDNWFKHCHTINKKDTENINNYKSIYNLNTTIDKQYLLFDWSAINKKSLEHQGNLLDEYFAGGNKFAKLIL